MQMKSTTLSKLSIAIGVKILDINNLKKNFAQQPFLQISQLLWV